ncbi:Glucose/mannose transporter GlcP [Thermoflexales bacterium]|nr:Glucose/mannose transporter GlcP [Thermoflexales bacterium]
MTSRLMTFLKTERMRWTLMYYAFFVCLGLSVGLVGPTLPSLAAQTQTLVGDLGAVFSASAVGALLGTLLGGRLFDRVRGHRALGIAQLLSATLIALYPVMPSAWLLLVVVVGKGLTDGFINTGANTLLVWTHKEKSSPYMNALHFFFGLGAFLAPILVAQVIEIPGGYRFAFWVLASVSGLAGLAMLTLKKNPQHQRPATTVEETTRLNYPLVIAAMLFLFFYVGAEIAFSGWIYTYARTLNLADATMAAYLTSGFWLTFTLGRLSSIPLATRFKPPQLIVAALTGCLSILLVALIVPMSSLLVWMLALVLGLCMAPVWPSGFTLAGQSVRLTSRVSGLILLGDSLGFMMLPWLVGQVLQGSGPQALIYLVFGSLVFNLMAFVAILRLRRTASMVATAEAAVLHE